MVVLWQPDSFNMQIRIMKKIILQGFIIVALFFTAWFLLMQVKWVEIFKLNALQDKTEEKLGDLFWEMFQKTETEIQNQFVLNSIDSIVIKICSENKIDKELIKIHVIEKDEINAFALPNGHLVIYTGLILNSDNYEEMSGVICHEMAHIQLNHVMKKLLKEVGLSVLISMTTGNSSSETIKETAKLLSSSAFDRNLEKEADIKAVDYLVNAKINPEPFAQFLYKLSDMETIPIKYLTWISTHPESKERAEYIIEYSRDKKVEYEAILTNETWDKMKEKLRE